MLAWRVRFARVRGHAVKFLHARSRARVSSEHSGHKRKLPQTSRECLYSDLWRVQIRARTASKPQTMKIIRKIRALVSDATFRYSFGSVSSKFIRTTIPRKSKARFAVRAYRPAHYRPGLRHAPQTTESRWSSRMSSQYAACPAIHDAEKKLQTMASTVRPSRRSGVGYADSNAAPQSGERWPRHRKK